MIDVLVLGIRRFKKFSQNWKEEGGKGGRRGGGGGKIITLARKNGKKSTIALRVSLLTIVLAIVPRWRPYLI